MEKGCHNCVYHYKKVIDKELGCEPKYNAVCKYNTELKTYKRSTTASNTRK